MGLFGSSSKNEQKSVPHAVEENPKEKFDDLPSLPKPRTSTVIAKGITLTGALHGEGIVQVEGIVEGELKLTGSVIVTTTGTVKGPITADVVRVAGRVEGSVLAQDHLRLEKTGSLEGDITTASLVVEDGGHLNGHTTMTKPPEKSDAALPDPSPMDDLQFGPNYKIGEEDKNAAAS